MEDATEKGPNYEQRRWEDEHFSAGLMRFGARDAREKRKEKEKTYDVIMDDEIEFVQALKMPGTMKEEVEEDDSDDDGGGRKKVRFFVSGNECQFLRLCCLEILPKSSSPLKTLLAVLSIDLPPCSVVALIFLFCSLSTTVQCKNWQ
jgi:hypothetical protein